MKLLRYFATPITIFSSLVVFATGLWMFFFSKGQLLEDVHSKLGVLFFIAAILHVVLNKGSFIRLIKSPATYKFALVALLIGAGWVWIGRQEKKSVPMGLVIHQLESASIKNLSLVFKVDPDFVVKKIQEDGLAIADQNSTLEEVAKQNGKDSKYLLSYFIKK